MKGLFIRVILKLSHGIWTSDLLSRNVSRHPRLVGFWIRLHENIHGGSEWPPWPHRARLPMDVSLKAPAFVSHDLHLSPTTPHRWLSALLSFSNYQFFTGWGGPHARVGDQRLSRPEWGGQKSSAAPQRHSNVFSRLTTDGSLRTDCGGGGGSCMYG